MNTRPDTRPVSPTYWQAYERAGLDWGEIPAWLAERRQMAWQHFSSTGFPTTRHEDWKYTPLSALENTSFHPIPAALLSLRDVDALMPYRCKGHRAVFVNGHFQPALSRNDTLPGGSILTSLRSAVRHWPRGLEARFPLPDPAEDNPLVAMNWALAGDGAFLEVAEGVVLDDPVFLLHITTTNGAPVMSHLHHMVVAGAGSRFSLVSHHVSLQEGIYFADTLTEIRIGRGAQVNYLKLQDEGRGAYALAQLRASVQDGGSFSSRIFSLGGLLAREDIHVELAEERAACELDGLYLANGRQLTDTHSRIDHLAAATSSRQTYKGILTDRARGVFNGRVIVRPEAQKTDARQINHNLLLSPHAEIDTKPQLEIFADDVKCSHGTTVGQLDENRVFYLRSRGLDEATARAVLTYAFAEDLVRSTPLACVRELVSDTLLHRLPGSSRAQAFFQEE